jgi:hypothetical protein
MKMTKKMDVTQPDLSVLRDPDLSTFRDIAQPKTASITLTSAGTRLTLLAVRRGEGAETFVTTTDAAKKTTRGMTEKHADFATAKAAIATQAQAAAKLGWVRRAAGRGFVARADAFTTLPAAPKVAPAPKAKK